MIRFTVNKHDHNTIQAIADRATAMALQQDVDYPTVEAMMDITAAHANGCKLKLDELLAAEPFDFAHDIFGIRRHLNRKTGQLDNHFLPRYAKVQS